MDILEQITAQEWLKHETASLHRSLDTMPQMRRLMRPDLCEQSYACTLSVLLNWTLSVGPALSSLKLPNYADPQHKINALSEDLKHLNHSTQNFPFKPHNSTPTGTDEAFALGLHYVLEGSSMGALILSPRIEASLKRTDVTRFYRLYGDQTHRYWQSTQTRLDEGLGSDVARQRAGEGARWAFTSLIDRFEAAETAPSSAKGVDK